MRVASDVKESAARSSDDGKAEGEMPPLNKLTSANSLKMGAAREAFCESRKSSWNALHDLTRDDHILTVALPLVMLTKIRETLLIELTAFCSSTSSPCAGSVRYLRKLNGVVR